MSGTCFGDVFDLGGGAFAFCLLPFAFCLLPFFERHAVSAGVGASENTVKVKWSDGVETQHNATWLRHNCACPQCVQEHSGQRLLMSHDLRVIHNVGDISISPEGACLRVFVAPSHFLSHTHTHTHTLTYTHAHTHTRTRTSCRLPGCCLR